MSALTSIVVSISALAFAADAAPHDDAIVEHPRFGVEIPSNVLTDVPVRKIVIHAYDIHGKPDPSYNEQPLITGIRLAIPESDDAKLGPFQNGVLELSTDLYAGRKVYVASPEIVVDGGNRRSARIEVPRTYRWLSIAPAVIAFLLCLWPRNFVLAIFIAVLFGTAILDRGDLFRAFVQTMDSFILVGPSQAGGAGATYFTTLTMIFFFGSLFAVISASGGLSGLTDRIGRHATTREHGQIATLILGIFAFFDDYAHALIVGKTLRPLSDRLKVSREKFAFLVDSTSAPVVAIVVISTWLAAERGAINTTFAAAKMDASATATLVASLPYCFYPILMVVFAALLIFLGHDFGPMLRAEWRAATQGHVSRPDLADPSVSPAVEDEPPGGRKLARNAVIPILLLFGLIGVGIWWTGRQELGVLAANGASESALPGADASWLDILEHAKPQRAMFFSAFIAAAAAVALAVWSRALTLQQGLSAWVSGLQRMVPAVLILVLSWSFHRICDADHLNTAGFLMEIVQPHVTVEWVPLIAFLTVGLISFVVGNSWAALPLALPLFISLTYGLLSDLNEASSLHPLLLATIGGVIGGTVFGHHCSPISETTVLASASTSCSHLDHVFTQLPYAMTVAVVAAFFGYAPIAYGYSPVVLLPVATAILIAIIQFGGRPAVQPSEIPEEAQPAETPDAGRLGARPGAAGAESKSSDARRPVAASAANAGASRPS